MTRRLGIASSRRRRGEGDDSRKADDTRKQDGALKGAATGEREVPRRCPSTSLRAGARSARLPDGPGWPRGS